MAIEKGRRGGLKSRAEREREQRERAKRSRTQLLGATQGGQRRPMRQGHTSSSVQPPPFRKSTVGADITQAGQAYKGGKGIFDWTQGKEAYTDKLGEFHKATEPFAGPSGQNLFDSWSQSFRDMPINSLFGDTAPMMQSPNIGGMGASFSPPQTASNLMGSPTSAFAGGQAGLNEAAMAADALQASQMAGDISATAGGANTALQTGAKGAGASFSSALPYFSIGLDLGTGGNTPITGDPYGDAAVRAAAAYATGGFSELGYGLGSLFDWW